MGKVVTFVCMLRKSQGNWVVEMSGRMHRMEVADDVCLRRPRPTQVCRANVDNDDTDRRV
jgi:hypothetical protein